MTATHEPCANCRGLGHLCDEEDDHIHDHEQQETCPACDGRGLQLIKPDDAPPLDRLTKPELIELAERMGLDTTGDKADLIERIQTSADEKE